MQPSGLHSSVFPFSYLSPDGSTQPGSSDGFSGTQPHHHHPSHTGFLKATEYRGQRTVKYTPSFGGEDGNVLRSIQRELEERMPRIGTNGPLRTADNDDRRDGGEEGRGEGRGGGREGGERGGGERGGAGRGEGGGGKDGGNRKWNRANGGNGVTGGNEHFQKTEDHHHHLIQMKTAYERRLPRSQGHLWGQGQGHAWGHGRGHVFHTDASGSFRKRHSDVDSGCHSDASEVPNLQADDNLCLVLPLSPYDEHPGLFDNFVLRTKFTAEAHAHSDFLRLPVSQDAAGGYRKQPSPKTGNCAQTGSHGYDQKDSHGYDQNGSHGNGRKGNHGYEHKGNHGYNRKDNRGYDQKGSHGNDRHHRNDENGRHGNRPEPAAAQDKRKPTKTNNLGLNHVTQSKHRMYLPPPPAISGPPFTSGHVTDPSKPPNEGGGTTGSCRTRTLVVVSLLLAFVLLVGFGAGFAAGWFGRPGAHS